jgi:hypothetical protein
VATASHESETPWRPHGLLHKVTTLTTNNVASLKAVLVTLATALPLPMVSTRARTCPFILREKDRNDHWSGHVVCGRKVFFFHSQKNGQESFEG